MTTLEISSIIRMVLTLLEDLAISKRYCRILTSDWGFDRDVLACASTAFGWTARVSWRIGFEALTLFQESGKYSDRDDKCLFAMPDYNDPDWNQRCTSYSQRHNHGVGECASYESAKIGIGIGVSLGALICVVVAALVYLRRKQRTRAAKVLPHQG